MLTPFEAALLVSFMVIGPCILNVLLILDEAKRERNGK
jgi:hypothetical protein